MYKRFLVGAVCAAALLMTAPAFACKEVTPNGSGSTNIRSGPAYAYPVKDELMSGLGTLTYCGESVRDENGKLDDNGNVFRWLYVTYTRRHSSYVRDGWVASSVVDY